jgi:long-chain acyl-CoA synthetase
LNFLERIFDNLRETPERAKLIEVQGTRLQGTDGAGILDLVGRARAFIDAAGVAPGDRVALLAPNSTRWVATDLAIVASGAIVVPLYDRQDPKELAKMLRSSEPALLIAATDELRASIEEAWPEHGKLATFDEVFDTKPSEKGLHELAEDDTVALIYTSGTSGEPKGVMLSRANIDYMIPQTIGRIGRVVGKRVGPDRVFHYLPFCFAASRMMLWTQLSRPNPLMMSTDLNNLVVEMAVAKPNYFLNVPAVLERIRNGVGAKLREQGGIGLSIYERGQAAYGKILAKEATFFDRAALAIAQRVVFPRIKEKIGPNLEFLISGSAPLTEDTQRWFQMIGVPVYQAYGLTETTGIVSLDDPDEVQPGRVGVPLDGQTVDITEEGELRVKGPNIFQGYWRMADETAQTIRDGWFHTGDQVEIDGKNLRIIGRIKNLIIPESGHNIAPEPLEEKFMALCPEAEQCMLVGHGRGFLAILVTGEPAQEAIDAAIEQLNAEVASYKKIRKSLRTKESFTVENGLLTANQKLRRRVIEDHFKAQIDPLYV